MNMILYDSVTAQIFTVITLLWLEQTLCDGAYYNL